MFNCFLNYRGKAQNPLRFCLRKALEREFPFANKGRKKPYCLNGNQEKTSGHFLPVILTLSYFLLKILSCIKDRIEWLISLQDTQAQACSLRKGKSSYCFTFRFHLSGSHFITSLCSDQNIPCLEFIYRVWSIV